MRKTLVWFLAIVSLVLVLSAVSAAPMAPDYTIVGVKVGDTATYHSSFTLLTWNKTRVLIYGIVGTAVTINRTYYDPSGSVVSRDQFSGDIYSGASMDGPLIIHLIAASLKTPDPIYMGAAETINDTSQMTAAGALRTINHINYNDGGLEVYWDQATGLMTELHWLTWFGWVNHSLLSTTAWSPDTVPSLLNMTTIALIEGVVIIALIIALIVVASRRKRG